MAKRDEATTDAEFEEHPAAVAGDEQLPAVQRVRDEHESALVLAHSNRIPALAQMDAEQFEAMVGGMQLQVERIAQIHRKVMKDGIHYGVIPGTKKPTLLQPGADLLIFMHGATATYPIAEQRRTYEAQLPGIAPFLQWDVTCEIKDAAGFVIGVGIGSCNSWETKYRYRYAQRICLSCGKEGTVYDARKWDKGWVCGSKKGGCGTSFRPDQPEYANASSAKVENLDVIGLDNTIKKIAAKRGKVAAALALSLASAMFTQDVEDDPDAPPMERDGDGDGPPPIGEKPAAQPQPKPAAGKPAATKKGAAAAKPEAAKPAADPPAKQEPASEEKQQDQQIRDEMDTEMRRVLKEDGGCETLKQAIAMIETAGIRPGRVKLTADGKKLDTTALSVDECQAVIAHYQKGAEGGESEADEKF